MLRFAVDPMKKLARRSGHRARRRLDRQVSIEVGGLVTGELDGEAALGLVVALTKS
jgi:hypothetical protein